MGGVLNDTAKRAMPELSQFLLDHGASLESRDREGFTLLMQAVLSMEPPPARDRMVEWLLSKGVDPNAKNDRGDTAYQLAARVGVPSTLDLLVKAGAKEIHEDWPQPTGGAPTAEAAVKKSVPAGPLFPPWPNSSAQSPSIASDLPLSSRSSPRCSK